MTDTDPGKTILIESIHIGKVASFGSTPLLGSAIDKHSVSGPVLATFTGLAGDEQADRKHHGGKEMAIHQYPACHYDDWLKELPESGNGLFKPGGFGENISARDMTEKNVCVGDVYALGDAVLQVSQARQPCWKLNLRFGVDDMASRVQSTLRTGWYYRVLEEGEISVGSAFNLVERPYPGWPLSKILHYLYLDTLNTDANHALSTLAALSRSWRDLFARRLESGIVEPWQQRITTPGA